MATPAQVDAWIQQAEADLRAARVVDEGIAECHRRYWIQQSCEKALKAYALMKWTEGAAAEELEFRRMFLLQHSPLKTLSGVGTPLTKRLHLLRREVVLFVNGLDNAALLWKIDGTTPRNDPAETSYRYPFVHEGEYAAPAAFVGWDAYQGNATGACAAVNRLIAAVRDERSEFARFFR